MVLRAEFKIPNKEMVELATDKSKDFTIYLAPLVNLANKFSQGTRPSVVGQMTELIKQCPNKDYKGWREWYLKQKPKAIDNALAKIKPMLNNFKQTIEKATDEEIKEWIEDLTIDKTYAGLKIQDIIIKKIALISNKKYRFSTPKEESKGIDGFIGETAVSVKPKTYKLKDNQKENIEFPIIFYEKTSKGLLVDASQLIEKQKNN